ncbi:M56 family metallopeptidase [Pedobacter sp. HMWF019]|uniref:M56 family metallopeptidase n=1 Tax=Pedobacter sp. HMWF019 TaxID=2056856 RepID=UPI001304BED3|nr:M56 family metallopeptidase [Pedobacter sp. HMWF019]
MPDLFAFLLKVNVSLILFCVAYYLILRRLTFYTLNRFFLLVGIFFSSIYPLVNLSVLFKDSPHFTIPVSQTVIYELVNEVQEVNYWFFAKMIFWAGVALMMIRMTFRLYSLYLVHRTSVPASVQQYNVRLLNDNWGTFSFWRQIYLNPLQHRPEELEAVLEHEQVHVNELHTMDILLAELATVFYWFNPGVWFMRKAVKENVEFITDQKILQKGADRKAYQYSMLYAGAGLQPSVLMNNFNLTAIKRRIVMMNSKKSSSLQLVRYVFILPVLLFLTTAFTLIRTKIQSHQQEKQLVMTNLTVARPLMQVTTSSRKKTIKHKRLIVPVKKDTLQEAAKNIQIISVTRPPEGDTIVQKRKINIIFKSHIDPESTDDSSRPKMVHFKIRDINGVSSVTAEATSINQMSTGFTKIFINDKEVPAEFLKNIKPSEISRINMVKSEEDVKKNMLYIYTVDLKN